MLLQHVEGIQRIFHPYADGGFHGDPLRRVVQINLSN